MDLVFYAAEKPRERTLAAALAEGCREQGDRLQVRYGEERIDSGFDVACMFGVKTAGLMATHRAAGVPVLFFDKGYTRHASDSYVKTSVNAIHPLAYFQCGRPSDRWRTLGIKVRGRRRGRGIVYCGSSAKFHAAAGLPAPTDYAGQIVRRLRGLTDRPILYRPKPSWREAVPVKGATLQRGGKLAHLLRHDVHALVTNGSNAAVDAIIEGVPVVALGETIGRPVAETEIGNIEDPFFPSEAARRQWLSDLAYCQWTLDELRSGEAWACLKETVLTRSTATSP